MCTFIAGFCSNKEATNSARGVGKGSMTSGGAAWASGFEQLAALQTGAEVTALHAMHPSKMDGLALFAAAGTAKGVLQFLSPEGQVIAAHDTG